MPSLSNDDSSATAKQQGGRPLKPLRYSGSLDAYKSFDVTPAVGKEFPELQVKELLDAPNSDAVIRDLAVLVAQRGVVFFRNQDIDPASMQELVKRASILSGSPASSGLHVHPLTEEASELGDQIAVISSAKQKKGGGLTMQLSDGSRFASTGWHSDITFEHVPSDFAMLKIHTLPPTGGDTLWASGYELYDCLSESMAAFLETLTATHDANFFHDEARRLGQTIRSGPRGAPENMGTDLVAVHPVIRVSPITGWKSMYINRGFTKRINEVSKDESDMLLNYLFNLIPHNHNAQVRFKWNANDMALWNNATTMHCATYDYDALRCGDRVCSVGEAPFFDPRGKSRRAALARDS